jgi:hypothetical protein
MGYKEKIRRIEEARNGDENPLVAVLNSLPGVKSWVNPSKIPKENQENGDVFMKEDIHKWVHSFEMQVSRKYKNFSYGSAKVTRFIGKDGGPCWVVLGCLDDDGVTMFYCLVGSITLQSVLEDDGPHVKNMGKYYIIKPEAFIGVSKKWIGNSLEEVINDWWKDIKVTSI